MTCQWPCPHPNIGTIKWSCLAKFPLIFTVKVTTGDGIYCFVCADFANQLLAWFFQTHQQSRITNLASSIHPSSMLKFLRQHGLFSWSWSLPRSASGDQPLKLKVGSFGPTKMWPSLNPIISSKGSKVWDIFQHISQIYFWGASIRIMSHQYLSDQEWNSFRPKNNFEGNCYMRCHNSDVNFHSETFASILFLPTIHWRFSATPNHKLVWKSCSTPV